MYEEDDAMKQSMARQESMAQESPTAKEAEEEEIDAAARSLKRVPSAGRPSKLLQ